MKISSRQATNLLSLFASIFVTSCARTQPPPPPEIPAAAPKVAEPSPTSVVKPTPQLTVKPIKKFPLKVRTARSRGIDFTIVSFDRRDFFLKVVDQPDGPGSKFKSSKSAGSGGLAAINGGFFTPEGKPLGIVISGGKETGSFNSASFLGTGILNGTKLILEHRKKFTRAAETLQSGPRLVWAGEKLTGLSDRQSRPRSFLLWDGGEHFALGYANSATLLSLSKTLEAQPISGFKIRYALNLDGGRSCDFWVSDQVTGGPLVKKSFLNKNVRNYLVLKRRKQ